jgi:FlaA1/EpsC-like NDP-sugar epimerase
MNNTLDLIGRKKFLFSNDINEFEEEISEPISSSSFLVVGGAGTIGQAVTKEIFMRNPKKLHVIDISENNLVELVRDIRSSLGYIDGDFKTFALDVGSVEFDAFMKSDGQYDYVLNLSALKHVRSEKDPYTLMRMIEVNIENTEKTVLNAIKGRAKKYFCVSTDKAANPVNMMGCSKRIMELFLMRRSKDINISTARFANVAFSDGSLLHGFNQRIQKNQPISAPMDIRRYFVTAKESGQLCLMSCILGENRDIFFPKLSKELHLITFSEIAQNYLRNIGYEPYLCDSEEEARKLVGTLPKKGKWPCYFFKSDTSGEKDFEEFFTDSEVLDMERFKELGIIKNNHDYDEQQLDHFIDTIGKLKSSGSWTKEEILSLFHGLIPGFGHKETGKYLDNRM